jgi:hypothetical protein
MAAKHGALEGMEGFFDAQIPPSIRLSMEEDVKKHDHPPPGDAPVLASGVHPRS